MHDLNDEKNHRVLVIDDNPAIHEDFRKILCPVTGMAAESDATELAVFGPSTVPAQPIQFEMTSAYQASEGVAEVAKAIAAGRPYALAFVDVRMPPGRDGVETARKIWELDPHLQIVLCTAYSDYSWGQIFEKLGQRDGLLILKKPFDAVEAIQLAHNLSEKWWMHHQSLRNLQQLESRVSARTHELQAANEQLKIEIAERARTEAVLRQTQKMEMMGQLAGGIAHDFNNILAVMFGYSSLLQESTKDNPGAQADIAEILTAANRAKDLVQQILTFSRKHEQLREVIQLDTVVKEAMKFLRASLPAEIEIEVNLAAGVPSVLADPTQMYQVTMNLTTNAFHAMEGQPGKLTVSLDAFEPDATFRHAHPEFRPGLHARLTITDTGHGMDAKTVERIFEPFFTTKPVGKGTGLGLAVVHGIIQSHGGNMTVESQSGRGTTFALYLPAQAARSPLNEAADGSVVGGHGQKILLLDDEPALTTSFQRLLWKLNYEVTTSNNAREAIALFRANPDQFDLVITDLTMPEMNGLEVTRQLRSLRPELAVILISGFTPNFSREMLHATGICELMAKPVSVNDLADVLQRALAKFKTADEHAALVAA